MRIAASRPGGVVCADLSSHARFVLLFWCPRRQADSALLSALLDVVADNGAKVVLDGVVDSFADSVILTSVFEQLLSQGAAREAVGDHSPSP